MRKLYLLFILLFTCLAGYGQSDQSYSENDLQTRTGYFLVENTPVQMNLPENLVFIDTESAKKYIYSPDSLSYEDVIGVIIPENVISGNGGDMFCVVSHNYNIGHVNDEGAADSDFTNILEKLKESDLTENEELKWAWTPGYDSDRHILSLPLIHISGNDTTLVLKQMIFGNEDMIMLEHYTSMSELNRLRKTSKKIIDAISFTSGYGYEDFDSNTQSYTYNSIDDFWNDKPAESAYATPEDLGPEYDYEPYEEESDTDKESFLISFIKIWGMVFAILILVMLLFMLAVGATNKKAESGKGILRSGINVLLRLCVFGMVYLLILMFAIFLVWAGVELTILILSHYISIKIIALIIGGWIIIGGFLWAIVRSLFVFSRSQAPTRLEISEADAPELYSLIKEISASAGEKMPRHVYVSPDVNACVFYDKPFASIFSQGRKNLEVGLGLLFGLNKQELKAIIAHEYGHFGQKSMRVGQVVSISYNIISNLVNTEKTSIVHPILRRTFAYVQRGYMKLSRSMEYAADEKGTMVAGSEPMISALCKLEVIAERFAAYNTFVTNIYESKKILPSTYWNGYKEFQTLAGTLDGITISETIAATAPLSETPKSRVRLKNPWISHPPIEQRIENIRLLGVQNDNDSKESILDIVPPKVYDETSELLFGAAGYTSQTPCPDAEYKDLLATELDENSFPLSMRAFFNRNLCSFEIPEGDETFSKGFDDVFSPANTHTVKTFVTALSDYKIMQMFKNRQTSEKEIQYDGKVYKRNTVPVQAQLQVIQNLEPEMVSIDREVCQLALANAQDKELIKQAYDDIFYAQALIDHINKDILPLRDMVAAESQIDGKMTEEAFEHMQGSLLNFKDRMKELLGQIDIDRLAPVMHTDGVKYYERIDDKSLFTGSSINGADIEYILTLPEDIIEQLKNLAYYAKKIVSDTIEHKAPLMYWNNSVAAKAAESAGQDN